MSLRIGATIVFTLFTVSAEPRTVCEALRDLSDLNGREVKIRGGWGIGDAGQGLFASPACVEPIVRDGWTWRDTIRVYPANGRDSVAGVIAKYREMRRAHPGNKIIVTLTGRLETRDHFDVRILPDGSQVPDAFTFYVAKLAYWRVEDLEAVPWAPGELEQRLQVDRRPEAVRAK
jgi:hypothetical protein